MIIDAKEWEGTDASLKISLYEYGLIWQHNDGCADGELLFIGKVHFHDQILYDYAYISENDIDWIEVDDLLSWNGLSREEWNELPLEMKVFDVYSFYSPLNLFNTYGAIPESEIEINNL